MYVKNISYFYNNNALLIFFLFQTENDEFHHLGLREKNT